MRKLLFFLVLLTLATVPAWADLPSKPCVARPGVTSVAFSEIVNCKIDPVGDRRTFSFSGTAGSWIDIFLYRTAGGADHCLTLKDPDGGQIHGSCVHDYFRPKLWSSGFRLTKSGSHQIIVSDAGDNQTFDFGLLIQPTYPFGSRSQPLQYGIPSSGSVSFLDKQVYVFQGGVNDILSARAIRTDGGADHCIRLIEPDGTEAVGSTCVHDYFRPQTTAFDFKVRKAGLHAIEVFDNGWDESFKYTLWLDCNGVCSNTAAAPPLRFVPITPCRISDTRNPAGPFGGPKMAANEIRSFIVPNATCSVPTTAAAYSLNVTVVPQTTLGYLSLWGTGQAQPIVSTLNSDGRIKANAAIVPAGNNGGVSVFVTHPTDVILDINGYFVPASGTSNLAFYPVSPCRVVDTRLPQGSLGGPAIDTGRSRDFPIRQSSCNIPATAQAYSLNFTAVPSGRLGYLTTWPTGSSQPFVSTLNSPGTVVANAAIVPAGTNGAISVFATDPTNVVIDINGYFAPPGAQGAMSFYAVSPCRVLDTRGGAGALGGPTMTATQTRTYPVPSSACSVPPTAQAYSLNATVVPTNAGLGYLTLWPAGSAQPFVSTLNALDGSITANAALVPAGTTGGVSAFVTERTDLILDINGYFAP